MAANRLPLVSATGNNSSSSDDRERSRHCQLFRPSMAGGGGRPLQMEADKGSCARSTICFSCTDGNNHSIGQPEFGFAKPEESRREERSNIKTAHLIKRQQTDPLATDTTTASAASTVKDKLASKQAPEIAAGGSSLVDEQHWRTPIGQTGPDRRTENEASEKTTSGQTSRRGLLEALIGERAKSWRDTKTVIVDIQNGRNKLANKSTAARDHRHNKESQPSIKQTGDESRAQREEPEQQQQQPAPALSAGSATSVENSLRLPTFGSIPQRLTAAVHLPYLSYSGRSRNVELASAANRIVAPDAGQASLLSAPGALAAPANRYARLDRSDGSAASLSSSSSSSTSSSSASCARVGPVSSQLESSGSEQATQRPVSRIPTLSRTSKFALIDSSPPQADNRQLDAHNKTSPQIHSNSSSNNKLSNLFAFSNISNLFPAISSPSRRNQSNEHESRNKDNPTSTSSSTSSSSSSSLIKQQQRSHSLVNLSRRQPQQQQANSRLQQLADKKLLSSLSMSGRNSAQPAHYQRHQQQQPGQRNRSLSSLNNSPGRHNKGPGYLQPTQATIMRRQQQLQEAANSPTGGGGGGLLGSNTNYATLSKRRGRPASAAGNYQLGAQHRSPSTGSLMARGSAGASPYGAGSFAGAHQRRSSSLLDPDCPVHQPHEAHPASYGQRQRQQHLSQPDLLYEPDGGLKGSPGLYSPTMSPQQAQETRHHRAYNGANHPPRAGSSGNLPGPPAYYNAASKFSAYYNSATDGVRPNLAAPNEQIRRILGYHRAIHTKPIHLHPQWAYSRPFIHLQPSSPYGNLLGMGADHEADYDDDLLDDIDGPRFVPFNQLQDTQAIRAIDFHPSGEVYAVGSNSRALRICAYPAEHELRHFNPLEATAGNTQPVKAPRVLFKFLQVHRGSIYCVSFNQTGQLLATGSNDQTVHIVRYNSVTHNPDGDEFRLTMHNGTIRDLCFIDDHSNGSALLLSAGGGDNKIYVTDCDTITPFQSMAGHTQMVMALHHTGGAQFVSGSYDKTVRFWDLRSRTCTSIISAPAWSGGAATLGGPGAPVCSLQADPSGRLLATGHTDSTCMLYDIRGAKIIQTFRPHDDEIRAISFSPKAYYLLTGAYDGRLVVSDLQGDLTQPLPSVCVAESHDKIVQAKWHPNDFTFVSTSADKTATLWALPGDF